MSEILHGGSGWGYQMGCRCDECRGSHAARVKRRAHERAEALARDPSLAPHGEVATYTNWGCRCPECTAVHSVQCADQYARRKAAS